MNSAILICSTIPDILITEGIRKSKIVISQTLVFTDHKPMFDEAKLKSSLVFFDVNLPLILLCDLRKVGANIILYSAVNHKAVFTSLNGLFEKTFEGEITDLLGSLNGKKQVNELQDAINLQKTSKIPLNTLSEIVFIDTSHIRYFEAQGNYTNIYTDLGKCYTSSRNIGFYEKLVNASDFFRCHHSYLVNLSKITRFIKGQFSSIEVDHDPIIEVSIRKKERILQLLGVSSGN